MKISIGSDHAGFELRKKLIDKIASLGHEAVDRGPFASSSVDYPDFAALVAEDVVNGTAERGVLVCGTGIGMSIAANKVKGVRAAVCRSEYEARMARAHNDANVLCLGERVTGLGLGGAIAAEFLAQPFEGGRHERRVKKISDLEK